MKCLQEAPQVWPPPSRMTSKGISVGSGVCVVREPCSPDARGRRPCQSDKVYRDEQACLPVCCVKKLVFELTSVSR